MIVVLMIITTLLALSSALTLTSMVGTRATSDSEGEMRAFYLADTGAQIGIAQVRAADMTLGDTSFSENVAAGSSAVTIARPRVDLYQIRSTGTYRGYQKTVEVYVRYFGGFALNGAADMAFGSGTTIKRPDIPVDVVAPSSISGKDHDAAGLLLADQSEAVYGLSMNKVPGSIDFNVSGGGTVEGVPSPTDNAATDQMPILDALRNVAATSADVVISGTKTLNALSTGSYGTPVAPKLVYAKLDKDDTLTMNQTFTGYGTLVIEVEVTAMTDTTRLDMREFATWNGLVMLYFRDKAKDKGEPLVQLADNARIVGGLSMFFNTNKVQINHSAAFLGTSGKSALLYSSINVAFAPGLKDLVEKNAQVTSYRLP